MYASLENWKYAARFVFLRELRAFTHRSVRTGRCRCSVSNELIVRASDANIVGTPFQASELSTRGCNINFDRMLYLF